MLRLFRPAPHAARLPDDVIRRRYPRLRWQIVELAAIAILAFTWRLRPQDAARARGAAV